MRQQSSLDKNNEKNEQIFCTKKRKEKAVAIIDESSKLNQRSRIQFYFKRSIPPQDLGTKRLSNRTANNKRDSEHVEGHSNKYQQLDEGCDKRYTQNGMIQS